MSLVAALLIGSSAFAIENVKVAGDAKLFYTTQDSENDIPDASLFDQGSSFGEASLNLGLTADLTEGVSAGATMNAITTLGLYNNLVGGTWTGGTEDTYFFSEAWLAGTYGNTTAKVGRQLLDTPYVFSETWSVVPNTFEAAVVINQDIPDTTVVGAFVGQHNSAAALGGGFDDFTTSPFKSFWNGAYAAGVVNNSVEPLTLQAWYFDAPQAAQSYWLQADATMAGFSAGLQYTNIEYTGLEENNYAVAAKLGYEMEGKFAISAAYSMTGEKKAFEGAGLLTGANLAGAQSKLYTEAWWYYGVISQADTTAYNVTLTAPVADMFDFGLYYTGATATSAENEFAEATFEVAKSFGPLDTGLYYIFTDSDADNGGDAYNTVQLYLTYNF